MTADMPRPREKYLHRFRTRHGKFVWYVRQPGGNRVRIRGDYGTPEFNAAYQAAIAGLPVTQGKPRTAAGSLAWLWERYRETSVWAALSPATRRQRENILVKVLALSGHEPYTALKRGDLVAARDARAKTPAQARNFLDAMRGLFRWALDAEHIKIDPTAGVKNPPKPKTGGFPEWTEDDVTAYQKRWPLGTKERVWLDMLLYTGPRRGDVFRLGRQHTKAVAGGGRIITFKTEKGGEMVEVSIPMLPVLEATLAAGPCGDLTFICGERGLPYTKESFGNAFSAAARKAGVKKSAHGVRKIAATTAADNGATAHQLMAIFGWTTIQMAEHYTKEANRRRLARDAAHMLGRVGTAGEITVEYQASPGGHETGITA
jgi:integrase